MLQLQPPHRDSSSSSHCCTTENSMELILDSISAAGGAAGVVTVFASACPATRQCTIEIQNYSSHYKLMDPRIYTYSGSCDNPLPPTIRVSSSGSARFIKTPHTVRGSVGVFTYDLYQNSTRENKGKMAVMFSNPFDFNLYSNKFAVGVFDMNKKCDRDLYNEMYNNQQNGFVRGKAKCGCITYIGDIVTIRATMSDSYKTVIKVQLSDD